MGGSSSKPALPSFQALDPTKGTYSGDYVSQLASSNAAAQQAAYKAAQSAYTAASSWKIGAIVGGILALPLIVIIIYDLIARSAGWRTILLPGVAHFSNFREGMNNQKCYESPLDMASGSFVDMSFMYEMVVGARDRGGCKEDLACIARTLGVKQSLAEAESACGNDSKCTAILHWSGKAFTSNFTGDLTPYLPLKGYYLFYRNPKIVPIENFAASASVVNSGALTVAVAKDCPPSSTPPAASSGGSNTKCYDTPIDFTSGRFLSPGAMVGLIMQADKTMPKGSTMTDVAKKLGNTQSLDEAKASCSSNPECKGIVYWDGTMFSGSDPKNPFNEALVPWKGYTPFTGDTTLKQNTKHEGPGTFDDGANTKMQPGSWTFTPIKDCPPPPPPPPPPPAAPPVSSTARSNTSVNTAGSPYSPSFTSPSTVSIPGPMGPTGPTGATGSYGTGSGMTSGNRPPPPLLWEWWYGSGSMAGAVDGSSTTVVPTTYAPLSAGNQGAYGMQWWMYIKDWNYGYGKEKAVIVRPDPSNPAIMNPRVVLHPTDNSLRISVSVFPSDENGSVAEPAAAGHYGSTDDVFNCEVPNIPLQSWFSVSLTVFERNLDVYLNGMLVKSCFMSGVPKPALGDIQVTPDGGFSGMVCGLATSNKMLNPSDALTFYSSDNMCHTISDKAAAEVNTTGYSVKFGVYDTVGRQVREYTF